MDSSTKAYKLGSWFEMLALVPYSLHPVCKWLYKAAPPDSADPLRVHIRKMGLKGKFHVIQLSPLLLQVIPFHHTGMLFTSKKQSGISRKGISEYSRILLL